MSSTEYTLEHTIVAHNSETESQEQTPKKLATQGSDSDSSPATRGQLSFFPSPQTQYISPISPLSPAISNQPRLEAIVAATSIGGPAGSAVPFDINAEDAGAIGTEPRIENVAAAAIHSRDPAVIDANHSEPYLIKATIGEDIQYLIGPLLPIPISYRIHPSSLDQQFIARLANIAKAPTQGTDLVQKLNEIIGLNITENVLTEDLKARLFYHGTPASLVFRSLVPLLPPRHGQLKKGNANSEIDTILLFERNGYYFSLIISCKSDYTRGRIGDEIKHLKTWKDLGFSIQLETGIKTEVTPEIFPIKDIVIRQYPALYDLVKSYPEEESLIARLWAAVKPRWIKAVLSPNPDQNNNIPPEAIRTDTVLGPRLIHILLSLSEFRELNEIISQIIRKLPEDYIRDIPPQALSLDPSRTSRVLEQELVTCTTVPKVAKKSSELTRIATHLDHLEYSQQVAEKNNQLELAACLALRLRTSLKNIPVVAAEIQKLQAQAKTEQAEILTTTKMPKAGLVELKGGISELPRRARKSSVQAVDGAAAAATVVAMNEAEAVATANPGDSSMKQSESALSTGVFYAYSQATAAGASATAVATEANPANRSEAKL